MEQPKDKPETEQDALDPDPDLVASRADSLTPEEQAAGVEDPESLAEAVLGESEARTIERQFTAKEHRRSPETVDLT